MHMKALYLASLMSVLKSYNKQTQGCDSWTVDKPKKNGEDVSMGGPHSLWGLLAGEAPPKIAGTGPVVLRGP